MSANDGLVSLWLARSVIESAQLDTYLEEEFDDDLGPSFRYEPMKASRTSAKSHFEADFSLWYDHDYAECIFRRQLVDVEKLLEECHCSPSFADGAVHAARAMRIRQSNAAFLIFDFGYDQAGSDDQVSASRHSWMFNRRAPLKFIGSFEYHQTVAKAPQEANQAVRKGRVFMMRITHLRGYNDKCEIWCVERTDTELVFYKNRGQGRTVRRTEELYQDAKHAQQAMAQMITEHLEADFFLVEDDWFTDYGFKLAASTRGKAKKKK